MALIHNVYCYRTFNQCDLCLAAQEICWVRTMQIFLKKMELWMEATLGCSLCQVWDARTTIAICLATRAEGLCWWRDNTGPMHKTGLASQKSSLISPMRSVSKDYVGLRWRNSGQIMRLTTATQRMWFLWILQMKRENSLFLSFVGGGVYRYYA